jgi:tRNA (adenine57-N1/adenine58-N1)-methyltransferase
VSDTTPAAALLRDGDTVLFIDRKARRYLRRLRAGGTISVRGRPMPCDALIGQPEGLSVVNHRGEPFLVLRPSYAELIPHLPRRAQPIYPKDVGIVLHWGDIGPGMQVIEIGVGPGALTLALLRAIGPTGALASYEIRADFATTARENVARFHGPAPQWTLRLQDACLGLAETGIDRVVVDVPEPWELLEPIAAALRPGGILSCFLPTVMQVKSLADALRDHPAFAHVSTVETLLRDWHVEGRSMRPAHRMVAHTGFLVFARRIPTIDGHTALTALNPYSSESTDVGTARDSQLDDEGGDSEDPLGSH